MNRPQSIFALCLIACLALAGGAFAEEVPDIGFVYPAGGQRGTAVTVTIGGQYLNGVSAAYVSGVGVQADVVKHETPLRRKIFNELRQKLSELNMRRRKREISQDEMAEKFNAFAESKGLKYMQLAAFNELRTRLHDPKRQPNAQLDERVTVQLTIDEEAPLGDRELRLKTSKGLTNPLIIQIGQYPEHNESEPNDQTADDSFSDKMPFVINGQILPGDVDRFRFKARKGMRLVASVEARSLIPYLADAVPGWFQATLSLQDVHGAEGAYSDDHGFDPDPIIYRKIPANGDYILEIRDAIYRGREDFVYRITVGQTPYITSLFPMGCRAGEEADVRLTGWNLRSTRSVVKAQDMQPGVIPFSVRRGRFKSNSLPFTLGALPESRESEPNNEPEQAQAVELPLTINGQIHSEGDQDFFQFAGKRGQQVVAEVRARRLGSALDSILKLSGADGAFFASNDDVPDPGAGLTTHQADSRIVFTLPADGSYLVHLADAQSRGGPNYGYRLRVSRPRPDFALRVVPSSINAEAGANVPITVYALRQDGFDGPIELSLADMPQGFSLSGATIPAGQEKVRLTMAVPGKPSGEPIPLRMEGSAKVLDRVLRRVAVPADDQMQAFLYRHLVPAHQCMVLVGGKARLRPEVKFTSPMPVRLPLGGTAEAQVAMPRWLSERLTLELDDPPPGLAIKSLSLQAGGLAFELTAEGDQIEPGLRGNLIIEAFQDHSRWTKEGRQRHHRVSVGFLPSLPFEITPRPPGPERHEETSTTPAVPGQSFDSPTQPTSVAHTNVTKKRNRQSFSFVRVFDQPGAPTEEPYTL